MNPLEKKPDNPKTNPIRDTLIPALRWLLVGLVAWSIYKVYFAN